MIPNNYRILVKKLSQVAESASLILKQLSNSDEKTSSRVRLQESIILGRRSEAIQTLDLLLEFKIVDEISHGIIELKISSFEALYLSGILEGYDFATSSQDYNEVVLTYPKSPSTLESELPKTGPETILIRNTQQVFTYLAETAEKSLVVVTPFLDNEGADVILDMFSRAKNVPSKSLVLRFLNHECESSLFPTGYLKIEKELKLLDVDIISYSINRPGTDRQETFHAKIVLADGIAAYVGSSNFNRHSFDNSMELGMLAKDNSVRRINAIVETMLKIGRRY